MPHASVCHNDSVNVFRFKGFIGVSLNIHHKAFIKSLAKCRPTRTTIIGQLSSEDYLMQITFPLTTRVSTYMRLLPVTTLGTPIKHGQLPRMNTFGQHYYPQETTL